MLKVNSVKMRDLMFARQFNIATLARVAKLTKKTISSLLSGKSANFKTIGKISAALQVPATDLLFEEN